MRLILVRHGQTPANVAHRLDTAVPGPGLTALGAEQAEALVDALDGQPVDALYASSLVRTQLTAAPLARARGLEVLVRDGLREVEAGDLEGRDDEEAQRAYLSAVFAWARGDLSARVPGAETGAQALGRFDAVVEEVAASGARAAVVVSHGAVVRMWVAARARGVDADFAASHPLLNTGVVVLEGAPVDRPGAAGPPGSPGGADGAGSLGGAAAGWSALSWAGAPVGAPAGADGPAAEPLPR